MLSFVMIYIHEEPKQCYVCNSAIVKDDSIKQLDCGHICHSVCESDTCMVCEHFEIEFHFADHTIQNTFFKKAYSVMDIMKWLFHYERVKPEELFIKLGHKVYTVTEPYDVLSRSILGNIFEEYENKKIICLVNRTQEV